MIATTLLRTATAFLLTGTAACAPAAPEGGSGAGPFPGGGPATAVPQEDLLVPPGYGTLRLDEVSLLLRSGDLEVRVTPLAESVTRLAASDIYERLSAAARSAGARGAPAGSALFLVSFFSDRPDVPFQPEDLQLVSQGRLLRAAQILPTTPGWTRQRLNQQEQQSAVYVFEGPVELEQGSVMVRYGAGQSEDWGRKLPGLQEERAKVRARAGGGTADPGWRRRSGSQTYSWMPNSLIFR